MRSLLRAARNLLSRNPDRRLDGLKIVADMAFGDFRVPWYQCDWWRDPEFNAYLDKFGERGGFHTQHRFMLWQLLKLARRVPGDTAECGTFRGAGSYLICQLGREHHIFDSFEGLSEPTGVDGSYWKRGAFHGTSEQIVIDNLKPYEATIHKGWIPDRFPDVADKRFAFVHVDVDLYQPTLDSFSFFYPRMNKGGVILCDDYASTTCPGATKAVDEYMADKPEPIVLLDAGGGFIIKE